MKGKWRTTNVSNGVVKKSETYKKDDKRERQRNWDGEIRIKVWKGKTIRANEQCGLFII